MTAITCPKCGQKYYGIGCPNCDFPQLQQLPEDPRQRKAQRIASVIIATAGAGAMLPGLLSHRVPPAGKVFGLIFAGVFILGGLQAFTDRKGRVAALLGAGICAGLSILFFYAAFASGTMSGGLPFLPDAWNLSLGKILFGLVGVMAAFMALYALRQALKPKPRLNAMAPP